jgi:U6 snRNA-associated Sm-like protein LSm8
VTNIFIQNIYLCERRSPASVIAIRMSSNLATFVDKLVTIITTDGRLLVGHLRGYDQTTNLILSAAQERTISPDEPCTTEDLGLYILRGDNVALVGETDEEKDQNIQW